MHFGSVRGNPSAGPGLLGDQQRHTHLTDGEAEAQEGTAPFPQQQEPRKEGAEGLLSADRVPGRVPGRLEGRPQPTTCPQELLSTRNFLPNFSRALGSSCVLPFSGSQRTEWAGRDAWTCPPSGHTGGAAFGGRPRQQRASIMHPQHDYYCLTLHGTNGCGFPDGCLRRARGPVPPHHTENSCPQITTQSGASS